MQRQPRTEEIVESFVRYVAEALVHDPESVEVSTVDGEPPIIELRVAAKDRGRVIGKNGRTAHAIRTLLASAAKEGEPTNLEILD